MAQPRKSRGGWIAALPLAMSLASCTTGEASPAPGDGGPPVCRIPEHVALSGDASTCGDVLVDLVHETCVGGICHHSGESPAGNLDLLSPCAPDRLVGVVSDCEGRLLVDPADPSESFILEKLEKDAPACGGARMPFMGSLAPSELACMQEWVEAIAMAGAQPPG